MDTSAKPVEESRKGGKERERERERSEGRQRNVVTFSLFKVIMKSLLISSDK